MDSTATVETDALDALDTLATGTDAPAPEAAPELVEQDLLVEDVSIDGMCGVY
jgi:mycofactocin precursor